MLHFWQVLTVMLVSIAMALSLAHALELPGKLRLDKEAYMTTQFIYYPGFTIGGMVGEAGGLLATLTLLFLTPVGSATFWLTLCAFLGLLFMHGVFWIFTQPANKFWLQNRELENLSTAFFGLGSEKGSTDWIALRNQWEYSHVARAVLALLSLAFLVTAIAL